MGGQTRAWKRPVHTFTDDCAQPFTVIGFIGISGSYQGDIVLATPTVWAPHSCYLWPHRFSEQHLQCQHSCVKSSHCSIICSVCLRNEVILPVITVCNTRPDTDEHRLDILVLICTGFSVTDNLPNKVENVMSAERITYYITTYCIN